MPPSPTSAEEYRSVDIVPSFISTRTLDDIQSAVISLCTGTEVFTAEDPAFPETENDSFSFQVPPTIFRPPPKNDNANDTANKEAFREDADEKNLDEYRELPSSQLPIPKSRSVLSMRSELSVARDDDALTLASSPSPVTQHPPGTSGGSGGAASSSAAPFAPPKQRVLCIWDVDDTLVATGSTGVRQREVFLRQKLSGLFRAVDKSANNGRNVRHLLLSQGSIDDVFSGDGSGKLHYLKKYFLGPQQQKKSSGSGSGSGGAKKSGGGLSSIFSCGTTRTKEAGAKAGGDAGPPPDLRELEPGTVLVRLANIKGTPEKPGDVELLNKTRLTPEEEQRMMELERGRRMRWLVLRPNVWGITLSSLSTIIEPSRNTAFVDGKCFRKLDVVASLAATGAWDSVFFVDNNLSELGVVKFGMQLSTAYELQATHRMYKFYQSDYLLLAASAALRSLEIRHGRDITVPPETTAGAAADVPAARAVDHQRSGTAIAETGATDGSSDSAATPRSPALRQETGVMEEEPGDAQAGAAKHMDADADADAAGGGGGSGSAANSSNGASNSCDAAVDKRLFQPGRRVQLVVAHFHMPSDEYRRVLRGANDSNDDEADDGSGSGSGGARARPTAARRGSNVHHSRVIGQPTFSGDSSLTDEQYEFVLKYFRHEESKIYQLIAGDVQARGYVDVNPGHRWHPLSQYVHRRLFPRPRRIACLHTAFAPVADAVQSRLVSPLSRHPSLEMQKDSAMAIYTMLLRERPFIDPVLTHDVAELLSNMRLPDSRDATKRYLVESLHTHVKKLSENPSSSKTTSPTGDKSK